MKAAHREDLIPAYRIKRDDGGTSLMFRCPHCQAVHSHGEPDGEPAVLTGRGAHCSNPQSPWQGRGYRLMIVGSVRSSKQLPSITATDIVALNEAVTGS
ncbi:hypothetical protein [Bradyrhizobium embrapense]